jgi:gliding motility-associated-like protein
LSAQYQNAFITLLKKILFSLLTLGYFFQQSLFSENLIPKRQIYFHPLTLPIADAGANQVIDCNNNTVTLDGSNSSSGADITYQWIAPNGTNLGTQIQQNANIVGLYTLVVTNTTLICSATSTVIVTSNLDTPFADAGNDLQIGCSGANVTLSSAGSSTGADITYEWVGAVGFMSNLPNPTVGAVGIYTLTVNNIISGCSDTDQVEITVGSGSPTADAGANQTLDCNTNSVILNGSSSDIGTNFSYQWIAPNGSNLGTALLQNATINGIYSLVVTNTVSNCSATATVEVLDNSILPTVNAGLDAAITCQITSVNIGGISAIGSSIQYNWTLGGITQGTNANLTTSLIGIYTLTVTNSANGCSATDMVEVTGSSVVPIADAGTTGTITCEITEVTLSAENSTLGSNMAITWRNSMGDILSSNVMYMVSTPGIYTLSVLNTLNGCESFDYVTVGIDTIKPVAKAGFDRTFTCTQTILTLNGGASTPSFGISYEWSGPGIVTNSDQVSIDVDEVGDYELTVTLQSNGCTASDIVNVAQNTDLPIATLGPVSSITCDEIEVTLLGGTTATNATFLWTGPDINSNNQNIKNPIVSIPGTYTLVVTDLVTGCKSLIVYAEVLENTTPPEVVITTNGNLDCQNQLVTLSSSTNISPSDATYQWSFNNQILPNGTTSTFLAENAGAYSLEITDITNGCSQLGVILVNDLSQSLPINITGAMTLNCLNTEIQLIETIASQQPNVNLNWSTDDGNITQVILNQTSIRLDAPGLYILTAENTSNGCIDRDTIEILSDFERPILSFSQDFLIGCAMTVTVLEVNAVSSTNNFSYSWSGDNFTSTEATPTVSVSGPYQVIVTQINNGCTSILPTFVTQIDGIEDVTYTVQSPDCKSIEEGIMSIDTVIGGTEPYLFSINNIGSTTSTNFGNFGAGDYTLIVTDAAGCTTERMFTIEPKPEFLLNLPQEYTIALGDSIQLKPQASTDISAYLWSDSLTLDCDTCANPWAKPFVTTSYTLLATNIEGCEQQATLRVIVTKDLKVFAPNVFAPEGIAGNDRYLVFFGSHVNLIKNFQIYDRWGELMYSKAEIRPNNIDDGWDGSYKNKKMAPEIYTFYIKLELVDGTTETVTGDFLLVR